MQALTHDEQGRRAAEAPTLFFLPHCEAPFCCSLLQANAGKLHDIAILGNSFQMYYDRWSQMHAALKRER